jgi:hypothetical protein
MTFGLYNQAKKRSDVMTPPEADASDPRSEHQEDLSLPGITGQAEPDALRLQPQPDNAEIVALRDGLQAIETLLTEELRERFGHHEKAPKGSRVYSLLIVPRNMARNALAKAAKTEGR